MITRRHLLKLTGVLAATPAVRAAGSDATIQIIDSNVSIHSWPFRRLPLSSTDKLVEKLRSLNIRQAWAGSFEGLLHSDVGSVNQRLADACRKHVELLPIGSVNLALPAWEEDLERCKTQLQMRGIRLHPNYHDYTLQDASFAKLLQLAEEADLLVQIAATMEDNRTQHPMLQVPDVDLQPLVELKRKHAGLRVQILNHRLRPPLLQQLAAIPNVCFDTARVDGTDGIPSLVKAVSEGRVLYGSHAPLLIPEAALIRVHESGQLTDIQLEAVYANNAQQVLRA